MAQSDTAPLTDETAPGEGGGRWRHAGRHRERAQADSAGTLVDTDRGSFASAGRRVARRP